MLYGVKRLALGISLIVLVNYYVAQREAVIQGLHQELVQQKIEAELNRELALLDPVTVVETWITFAQNERLGSADNELARLGRPKRGDAVVIEN